MSGWTLAFKVKPRTVVMYRNGYLPSKLGRFLDHCTNLIFLRKVGGGYIFIHRLLLEHFAAMWDKEEEKKRAGASLSSGGVAARS